MRYLFWGTFFAVLNIDLTVGSCTVDVLPNFVGYFLLMKGMTELSAESDAFAKGRHLAFGMTIFSAILFVLDLMDLSVHGAVKVWGLRLVGVVMTLVVLYQLVSGVEQMEKRHGWKLDSVKLRNMWLIQAVLTPIIYLLIWIPMVGVICTLASGVVSLVFLVALYGSKMRYDEYHR